MKRGFDRSPDRARQMGFITDERRRELYRQAEHLKPSPKGGEV